jgi:hypothetical protein
MMHVDYLEMPKPPASNHHRVASTAVKFMPETLSFQNGNELTVTMPLLPGITQSEVNAAATGNNIRVFRFEREYDNGDGTFGRLVDISADITDANALKRSVTFTTGRLGIFQIAIEYP